MNTRRSPRNQARLWRALGGAPAPRPKRAPKRAPLPPETEEETYREALGAPAPTWPPVYPGRNGGRMETDASGRPPSDIAGLRNQVRQIIHAAEAEPGGKDAEATLQLYALLDDLRSVGVFQWSSLSER